MTLEGTCNPSLYVCGIALFVVLYYFHSSDQLSYAF